jgi:hypothetical protein
VYCRLASPRSTLTFFKSQSREITTNMLRIYHRPNTDTTQTLYCAAQRTVAIIGKA